MTQLGRTELDVFPLCLGGNVFGWTADEAQSFAVLDAYTAAGGNFIDTADVYSAWEHGRRRVGDDHRRLDGRARQPRPDRHRDQGRRRRAASSATCSATTIDARRGARLRACRPTTSTSTTRTSTTRRRRSRRRCARSTHSSRRAKSATSPRRTTRRRGSTEALELQREHGLAELRCLQPHYNLVERDYERTLLPVCRGAGPRLRALLRARQGLPDRQVPAGRRGRSTARAPRPRRAYLDSGGAAVLAALDEIAAAHETTVAAVALAWLRAQPTVVAPIASARTIEQLEQILPAATLELTPAELDGCRNSVSAREPAVSIRARAVGWKLSTRGKGASMESTRDHRRRTRSADSNAPAFATSSRSS